MMNRVKYSKTSIVLSFFSSIAMTMDFKMPQVAQIYKDNCITEAFWNLKLSMNHKGFFATLIFAFLVLLFCHVQDRSSVGIDIISILLAIVWLYGVSFSIDNTTDSIVSSPGQLIKACIYLIGMTGLIRALFIIAHDFLSHQSCICDDGMDKKEVFRVFLIILVCWLPFIIISFPGYICVDAWNQLGQYFEISKFTSHHPPAHTLFMGMFVQIGIILGNGEIGIFLFVLFQVFFFAALITYLIYILNYLKICKKCINTIFVLFIISPYTIGYVGLLLKDNIYSYFFLLFMIELCKLIENSFTFKNRKHVILWILSVVGVILFRNNGKYVIYPFVILMIIYLIVKFGLVNQKYILFFMVVPIVVAGLINIVLMKCYNIEKGSIKEALSLPFQQTARYVKYYEDDVSEYEKNVISQVLDYEKLESIYNPVISDPVKSTFRLDSTKEDLIKYFKVWIKQFIKHPSIYFEATLNQNYFMFYPFYENSKIYRETYYDYVAKIYSRIPTFNEDNTDYFSNIKTMAFTLVSLLFSLPIIGAVSNPAIYVLVLIVMLFFSVKERRIRFLLLAAPIVLSVLIIILSPCILNHPRYAFPIIYSFPIIVAYYIRGNKDTIDNDSSNKEENSQNG